MNFSNPIEVCAVMTMLNCCVSKGVTFPAEENERRLKRKGKNPSQQVSKIHGIIILHHHSLIYHVYDTVCILKLVTTCGVYPLFYRSLSY